MACSSQLMAKGFNRLHKFCSSASTSIEQRIDLESEGHKLGLEKNKFQAIKPTEKNCRRRPENLIRKLFFTAINFKPRNEERRKSNMYEYKSEESQNSSIHMSQIVPTSIIARQPTFESQNDLKELANGESKPKVCLIQIKLIVFIKHLLIFSGYTKKNRKELFILRSIGRIMGHLSGSKTWTILSR